MAYRASCGVWPWLKKIAELPSVVSGAAESMEPHRLLYFAQGLIADFHSYFTRYRHEHRIVSDDAAVTQARLGLVAALRLSLKQSLGLLGISAPDWMETSHTSAEDSEADPASKAEAK